MQISRIVIKLAALLGLALALTLGSAHGASAQAACDPALEGVEGYEGYDGYEGCEEATTTTTTTASTTTTTTISATPLSSGGGLPNTGGITMLAAAGVIGAVGLTIRRLAIS